MKCSKCKKEKEEFCFQGKNKTFKSCFECREQSRKWRAINKERVSDYNKLTNQKKNKDKKNRKVYAKKKSDADKDEWLEFSSQAEASRELKLQTANISKVINGKLTQTGGYIFKIKEIEQEKKPIKSWEEIKEEKKYSDLVKGQPSKKRIFHESINGILGKKCCKCKEWRPLKEYNFSESHWDKLRVTCKHCLVKYRKENRIKISKEYVKYEKKRKAIDPEFKLLKTLRSRLSSAIKNQNGKKSNNTLKLVGCSIPFLKGYLEAKFKDGMTWENHGKWHIDHIKPCCSFNLLLEEEQKKCFNYKNLQPLWEKENLSKSGKY